MGGSIAKPRLPQTQKCMKHGGLHFSTRKNISRNTNGQEKLYKKIGTIWLFFQTLCAIFTRNFYGCHSILSMVGELKSLRFFGIKTSASLIVSPVT